MRTLAAAVALIALTLQGCAPQYSSGFRVGVVQKASLKGLLWRSFEGELQQGGFTSRSKTRSSDIGFSATSVATNIWEFSATDPAVMADLERAAADGRAVKLHYRQWLIAPWWAQSTSYTVVRVEDVGDTPKANLRSLPAVPVGR